MLIWQYTAFVIRWSASFEGKLERKFGRNTLNFEKIRKLGKGVWSIHPPTYNLEKFSPKSNSLKLTNAISFFLKILFRWPLTEILTVTVHRHQDTDVPCTCRLLVCEQRNFFFPPAFSESFFAKSLMSRIRKGQLASLLSLQSNWHFYAARLNFQGEFSWDRGSHLKVKTFASFASGLN